MDDHFDRLSRAMAGSLPRRRALKLIAASAAGVGLGMLGLRPAPADAAGCRCVDAGQTSLYCQNPTGNGPCPGCKGANLNNGPYSACTGKQVGDPCSCG